MNGTGNVPSRPFGSSGAGRRGPPACASTHCQHGDAYAARCVPTLPADNLVYTTCAISGITRDRVIFEIVRSFVETADGIAKATGLKPTDQAGAHRHAARVPDRQHAFGGRGVIAWAGHHPAAMTTVSDEPVGCDDMHTRPCVEPGIEQRATRDTVRSNGRRCRRRSTRWMDFIGTSRRAESKRMRGVIAFHDRRAARKWQAARHRRLPAGCRSTSNDARQSRGAVVYAIGKCRGELHISMAGGLNDDRVHRRQPVFCQQNGDP